MMKKTLIAGLLSVMILFAACSPFPEGPNFTLTSKTNRLAQKWAIILAVLNGNDVTAAFADIFFNINKDGNYTVETPFGNQTGTWAFIGDDSQVVLTDGQTSDKDTFDIIRLTKKEWKAEENTGNDKTEYTFNPTE